MKLCVLFFCLLFSEAIHAQNIFNYLGTIILNNNNAMTFKLNLIEKDGIVNGHSITNIGLKDETKSEITGLYFKSDQSFQIQETQILQTNSEAPLNTFCYLNMNLSFEGRFKKKRLEGTFIGNFLDNTECARGKIIMMEEEKIKKKVKKIKKKFEKQYTEKLDSTNLVQQTITLNEGDDFSIKWKNKKVKLFIWDNSKEDGDRIRLKINNQVILDNFETKNKRKKISLKLQEGENIIEIKALNIGLLPPNTSRIELVDSKTKYPIMTQLETGKSVQIKIIK